MKKLLISFLAVFMFLATTFVLKVPAYASEYDLFHTGRVTFTVDVPQDFDRVVYVTLMDDDGSTQQFPILPESKYRLVEDIVCGPFMVSGFVENDPWFEYVVLRDQDTITVSPDQDLKVRLTVTTEVPEIEEMVPEDEDIAPDETEGSTEITEETAPSESSPEEPKGAEDEDKPFWLEFLGTIFFSGLFALLAFVVVYLVRKRLH